MDITVEEKLRLLQKLKEDENQNQDAIRKRNELLNHASSRKEQEIYEGNPLFSFKLRILTAFVLFGIYLVMQLGNYTIGTLSAEKIVGLINESSDIKSFDFPLRLPYTLKE